MLDEEAIAELRKSGIRVIASAAKEARQFLQDLKKRLMAEFAQEEILIVERDVQTL